MTEILEVDRITFDNVLALFEEMQINGNNSMEGLYTWWIGEQDIINQTIFDLNEISLDAEMDK